MSSKTLHVDLITPEKEKYSGEADYVEAPGKEGILGILPQHASLISTVKSGQLKVADPHKIHYFAIGPGFIQVRDNRVLILVNQAFRPLDINLNQAVSLQKKLEEELESVKETDKRDEILSKLRLEQVKISVFKREQSPE